MGRGQCPNQGGSCRRVLQTVPEAGHNQCNNSAVSFYHFNGDGTGTIHYYNGSIYNYKIKLENGKAHGSVSLYDGEWKDGKEHRYGTYTWADVNVYEEEWKNGKMNGIGAYTYDNSDICEGREWQRGRQRRKTTQATKMVTGTITYTNGDICKGELKSEEKHGRGVCKHTDGEVYDGEWKKIKARHRRHVHDGEWKDCLMHGNGTCTHADGVSLNYIYKGQFKDGIFQWEEHLQWGDGSLYEGEYKDAMKHGHGWGTMKLPSGDIYEGEWANEKKAHGKKTWPMGAQKTFWCG